MKPRLRYNWDLMRWLPLNMTGEYTPASFDVFYQASIIAETINRRIRLRHVGAHV
jgi:hypothetical protein